MFIGGGVFHKQSVPEKFQSSHCHHSRAPGVLYGRVPCCCSIAQPKTQTSIQEGDPPVSRLPLTACTATCKSLLEYECPWLQLAVLLMQPLGWSCSVLRFEANLCFIAPLAAPPCCSSASSSRAPACRMGLVAVACVSYAFWLGCKATYISRWSRETHFILLIILSP